ncbi:MAG TPA: ammonia-forming cytochrome c nitrite reductase subunit c552, partial [Planctomycetaceae bacterium]|nr:ammonia-forming cytochrome c nitrite reductase subunit c552 [Planctomycetaceae bacterium]
MTDHASPAPSPVRSVAASRRGRWLYVATLVLVAAATIGVLLLLGNIFQRQREAEQIVFQLVDLDEHTIDPAVWGRNFPRQYDSYRRTVDMVRTRHGGSEAFQRLDEFPRWRTIFAGYAFAVDYREERGHAYMLSDQDETERVRLFQQPGACLHCHSSVLPAYRQAGREAGLADDDGFNWPQVMRGFEVVCGLPYQEARQLVAHPVACVDCHDPQTIQLRITRPAFINGVRALAESDDPLPHLPSIERWRQGGRTEPYDPNTLATRQEMRSFVCGQCHVEYYFRGEGKLLTYPWHNGLKAEQIEAWYDDDGFADWTHAESGARVLKAQHPEFEMWNQGIHAASGVACADCHMPYVREGAVKVSDHHVRSPLLNIARACQTCHRRSEADLLRQAERIQDRTRALMDRAEIAVVDLINGLKRSRAAGADDEDLRAARELHRQAQWRLDFVAAENSMGFHADQEAARLLAEAIDLARQGQLRL